MLCERVKGLLIIITGILLCIHNYILFEKGRVLTDNKYRNHPCMHTDILCQKGRILTDNKYRNHPCIHNDILCQKGGVLTDKN